MSHFIPLVFCLKVLVRTARFSFYINDSFVEHRTLSQLWLEQLVFHFIPITHFQALYLVPFLVRMVSFSFHISDSYLIFYLALALVRIVSFSFHINNSFSSVLPCPSSGQNSQFIISYQQLIFESYTLSQFLLEWLVFHFISVIHI